MGTDNFHSKRKAKTSNDLKRGKPKRELYDKVLIVCEGKKTEPNYLKALVDFFKLSQANIIIDLNSDSSPTSVVEYAIKIIKKNKKENKSDLFNRVFCVIDRDRHADFNDAISIISSYKNKDTKLEAIVSNPCFEYWILMHYEYTTRQFGVSGSSPCEDLIKNSLRKHIPDYQKGDAKMMPQIIEDGLENAIKNSKNANNNAEKSGIDNPTTRMDCLVEYLRDIKK